MVVLTNCLTDTVDEGCLKIATSLIKRLKKSDDSVYVVSYDREHNFADEHISVNKLMLNRKLSSVIRKRNEAVLYIPFPARTLATSLRIFMLSLFCKKGLGVLMVQKYHYSFLAKMLLKFSRAKLIVLSKEAQDFYGSFVNKTKVIYIKAGVDTKRFFGVDKKTAEELKEKYDFDKERPVVLHVGHLNKGRGVDKLKDIDSKYQVALICSTLTKDEQDIKLKDELLKEDNIRIIEEYIPHIEELYQLSDVYFFPTQQAGNCIDIPLSCMEAAACNIPVVTTDFGEMKEFISKDGFYFMDSVDKTTVNKTIEQALCGERLSRNAVMSYDFSDAVDILNSLL